MKTLTTTIERKYLDAIISGEKRVEYRELKPYWTHRLAKIEIPFRLRLINGMSATAPEATVEIHRITTNRAEGCYELHIAQVLHTRNLPQSDPPAGELRPAYFFLWNPERDTASFRRLDQIIAKTRFGEPYVRHWCCPSTRPRPGDVVYMQRTGSANNGVFARGLVTAAPRVRQDGTRRIRLELKEILPLGREIPRGEVLSEARYAGHWAPYASGNVIPPRILAALESLWQRRRN